MNEILLTKNILKTKSIGVITVTGVLATLLNRTKYKNVANNKKFIVNILIGIAIIKFNKNKLAKKVGIGILISGIVNLIYDSYKRPKCPFIFKMNRPIVDSLLINLKTGDVIQKNNIQRGILFVTQSDNVSGWNKSFKLQYCLDFTNNQVGEKTKEGQLVLWQDLKDHTIEFNNLLIYWVAYFKDLNLQFEEQLINYPYKLSFWIFMVSDGQELDIKSKKWKASIKGEWSKYNNTLVRYDDYGNILYGAAGTAFGISESVLFAGANLNQMSKTGFDDEKDTYSIQRGIDLYYKIISGNLNQTS
jgi:hypothetical protein